MTPRNWNACMPCAYPDRQKKQDQGHSVNEQTSIPPCVDWLKLSRDACVERGSKSGLAKSRSPSLLSRMLPLVLARLGTPLVKKTTSLMEKRATHQQARCLDVHSVGGQQVPTQLSPVCHSKAVLGCPHLGREAFLRSHLLQS